MLAGLALSAALFCGCSSSQAFTPTGPSQVSEQAAVVPTPPATVEDPAPAQNDPTPPEAPADAPKPDAPKPEAPKPPTTPPTPPAPKPPAPKPPTTPPTPPPPTPPPPPAPEVGTVINPGDDIQAAVNANPAGTAFTIRRGVHRRQQIRPKNGMSFVGEAGAVLDGEGATPHAFVAGSASSVTIRGLRITNYAPPNSGGAVHGDGSSGWTVEDNEIDNNTNGTQRTSGLRIGSQWNVRRNRIHHNGWLGISGYQAVGTIVEDNEVYANPATKFNDTVGEAANMKFYGCGRLIIRGNYVHDGPTKGIWMDRSQPDITIEGNRVVNQGEAGIWYEVSYRGTIRGNTIENAGYDSYYSSGWLRAGGISVTNSPDVSVLNNTVINSLNGIIGLQASGYYNGPYGASQLRNLLVQGNTVVMPRGQTGIAANVDTVDVYDGWNNRFLNNRYQISSNAKPFYWKNRSLTPAEWQAGPGGADTITP